MTAIKAWIKAGFSGFKSATPTLERCYSMAQSGDEGLGFHDACDGKGPTVTIVKTTKGFIFGGASDKDWASSSGSSRNGGVTTMVASDSAFLFCVKCAGAGTGAAPSQLKLTGKNNQNALIHQLGSGPLFGGGNDLGIYIYPDDRRNTAAASRLGDTYTCPVGPVFQVSTANTPCNSYLGGSWMFDVDDFEVFAIVAV